MPSSTTSSVGLADSGNNLFRNHVDKNRTWFQNSASLSHERAHSRTHSRTQERKTDEGKPHKRWLSHYHDHTSVHSERTSLTLQQKPVWPFVHVFLSLHLCLLLDLAPSLSPSHEDADADSAADAACTSCCCT